MSLPSSSRTRRTPRPKVAMAAPISIPEDNPLAYREQSLAMGEKIDFTRDSVYTVPAKIANDENNNSLLSNIDFRRDTMEGRYSITTQGPRFSDADLSPKDPARCGALGGLETIEEGQEDSRGSAYEKSGSSKPPIEPWRSSIAESDDLAGDIDGVECSSRSSVGDLEEEWYPRIMSLPPLLPKASLIGSNIGPLASRIDHESLASIIANRPNRSTTGDDELEAKRRKMSQALSCADADDDEVYRPSLTMARALQKYHSFGHVYSSVEESQPESEVEGGQECEELEVAEETEGEVGAGDNQNDSDSKPEGESPTVNPSPPNTVTASPQHIPSPPPPAPTAKGSPPIGLPSMMGKGKAPPPPLAVGKGKAPFPSPPGMKTGKSPLPLKAPIKMGPPVAPLRPLFWTSVPMGPRERLENNFWKSVKQNCKMIDEDTIPWCAEFVHEDELQTMFGQNASKVAGKSVGNRSVAAPPRHGRKVLKLLDDKRSHMLAIAFRPLPEPDELVKIIASGNVAALTGTQLSMLADEVPTPDFVEELAAMETRSLQEGVQTQAQWDTPEQYLVALSTADDAQSVLTAWAFGANVRDGLLVDVSKQLDALDAACTGLRESRELVDLVRVMLSIGNRVNANTARGGAEILSIDSLLKFDSVRSPCDPTMTLLRYCVQTWKKKNGRSPSMISMFTKLLTPVTNPKTKIPDIKEVENDVKRIAELSKKAKTLLERLRQQPNYEKEVIPLIEDGIKKTDELQERLKKTMMNWKLTLQYFCVRNETPMAEKSDEFFDLMKKFILLVGNYAAMD